MPRNRTYEHKFDWDEAKRLYSEDVPLEWIASKFRVTPSAVRRIVVPGAKEQMDAYSKQFAKGRTRCRKCGAPTNYFSHNRGWGLCKPCAAEIRRTTIRETELRCSGCKQWLPDDAFYKSNDARMAIRRGRRRDCRVCSDKSRERYRQTHRVPCKGGCGRIVSPGDQQSNAKQQNRTDFRVGYCPTCNRQRRERKKKPNAIQAGSAKFRKKYGTASDRADTTSPEREE